jgi:WD40 repeat protein
MGNMFPHSFLGQLYTGPLILEQHHCSWVWGGDIIILDAITGSQMAVLSGHTWVNCLTFSSDGKSLVSGSDDKTVKLWDMQTGGVVKTFHGHTQWVWSVSISADHTRIASGSGDHTICLWDIQTGECLCTIQQPDDCIPC